MGPNPPLQEVKSITFAALDALRGSAAVMVVMYHFLGDWGGWGGYLAVDFFLVLSGFILSHSYLYKAQTTSPITFIQHRVARLYPLHIFTLFTFILVSIALHGQLPAYPDGNIFTFIQQLTLTQNIGLNPNGLSYNFPSWSISVEFWVNFLFIFFISKTTKSSTLFIIALMGLAMIYINTNHLATHIENYYQYLNSGMVRGISSFFLGIISYRIYLRFKDAAWVLKYINMIELLCIIGIVLILFARAEQYSSLDFFAPFLFMVSVAAFTTEAGLISKQLTKFRYLGTISYSIYLNQLTLLLIVRESIEKYTMPASIVFIIYLLVLLIYSHFTFQYIENPLRKKVRALLSKNTTN